MRPNQPSPSLPLLHTSFQQPRPYYNNHTNDNHHTCNDCYSYSTAPTSPLSSTSTITSSSPTLPSSPTSPSTSTSPSPFQFQHQHIRHPRPIYEKLLNHDHNHSHSAQNTILLLRRRPSTIDTLLRQERSRYDEDFVERQSLDLLEPRPVDLDPIGIDTRVQIHLSQTTTTTTTHPMTVTQARMPICDTVSRHGGRDQARNRLSPGSVRMSGSGDGVVLRPRFVMGGIFEVMEGRG
ncbi:hypothetical protein BDW59DRAFT_151701 [Aspergillus cavernicola]|uniref:Uncharacterized protein n=1 Tax=Aspergillus cavernicola TaxID=176166 RepID=A0ABR4HU88_9EURO